MKLQISLIMILSLLLIMPSAFGATIALNAYDSQNSINNFAYPYLIEDAKSNTCSPPSANIGTAYYTYNISNFLNRSNIILTYADNLGNHSYNMSGSPWTAICDSGGYIQLKVMQYYSGYLEILCEYPGGGEHQILHTLNSNNFCEQSITFNYIEQAELPCTLTCPGINCIFYDVMNYTDSFTNCLYSIWSTQPPHPDTIVPTVLGENFYGLLAPNYMDLFDHDINYAGNYFNEVYDTYTVFWGCAAGQCEPFYDASGQLEHSLIYKDFTSSADITSYHVIFYYDPYGTIYGAYETNETLFPFCASCFEPYAGYHKIEIRSFNFNTPIKTFVNGTLQYYARNSFSIFIDGTPIAYNLPLANTLTSGHVNIPKTTSYSISKAVVLTALEIEGRTGFGETNTTENLGIGTPCNTNSECLTGLCEYHYCGLKSGNMPCTSDSQCISAECVNSRCTRADLWTMLDTSKNQQFGTGTLTNNFISLFLMIGIAIGMIILGKGSMGAMIASGASFIGLAIFFTLVGWLSPFIMIGAFLIMIIITILLVIIMGPRG